MIFIPERNMVALNFQAFEAHLAAVTVATEVPPHTLPSPTAGKPAFTLDMIEPAIRAVIDVIRNRLRSPHFPNTVAQVLFERKAFSAIYLGQAKTDDLWARAAAGLWQPVHVARCLRFWQEEWPDMTEGSTHYYSPVGMSPSGAAPAWARTMQEVKVEGIDSWWFTFLK